MIEGTINWLHRDAKQDNPFASDLSEDNYIKGYLKGKLYE